ncbi:MAG: hypothetical protein HYU33_07825, partial [Candidatus Omnitrophica bacterium]|nr:hypothetical protein [Candidatus Omnitrophota bacterium]
EKKGEEEAWRLVSVVTTALALLLTLVVLAVETSLFVALRSVSLEAKWEKTLELSAIMFPYSLFICLTALVSAILNCLRHFFMPAFSPVILNLCWIGSIFLAVHSLGKAPEEAIYVVAIAVLVAGLLQLGSQWLIVRSNGGRVRLLVELSHPGLREIVTNMGPVVFGLAVVQINVLVDSLIAVGFASPPGGPTSFEFLGRTVDFPLKSGAASVLYYGDRLMEFPLGMIGVAMATAVFPTLSTQSVRGDWSGFSETLKKALSMVLFVGIPAAVVGAFTGIFQTDQALIVFLVSFCATAVFGLFYCLHVPFLRCFRCDRRLTVQWTKEQPKFSRKVWFLRGWGALILDVLINKRFRCMYCGQWYSV